MGGLSDVHKKLKERFPIYLGLFGSIFWVGLELVSVQISQKYEIRQRRRKSKVCKRKRCLLYYVDDNPNPAWNEFF